MVFLVFSSWTAQTSMAIKVQGSSELDSSCLVEERITAEATQE